MSSYFGNLTQRQIALTQRLKAEEIQTLEQVFKRLNYLLNQTRHHGGSYTETLPGEKPVTHTERGIRKKIAELNHEISEISHVSLPEFLIRYPKHLDKLKNEFPGEVAIEGATHPAIFVFAIMVLGVAIASLMGEIALFVYAVLAFLALAFYTNTHKVPPKLVAVNA